jgi:hypothetical protein
MAEYYYPAADVGHGAPGVWRFNIYMPLPIRPEIQLLAKRQRKSFSAMCRELLELGLPQLKAERGIKDTGS